MDEKLVLSEYGVTKDQYGLVSKDTGGVLEMLLYEGDLKIALDHEAAGQR